MSALRSDYVYRRFFDCGFESRYRIPVCYERDEARKGLGIRSSIHPSSLGGMKLQLSGGKAFEGDRLDRVGGNLEGYGQTFLFGA